MTKLDQLYTKLTELEEQHVTGVASSMHRHHKMAQLQQEIDYYELGDTISREEIQVELAEMEEIQKEINRLTSVLDEKRQKLITNVFGSQSII